MGNDSNSRDDFLDDLNLDELGIDFDLDLDAEAGQFGDLSESPLYMNSDSGKSYARKPVRNKGRAVTVATLCIATVLLVAAILFCVWMTISGGLDDGLILPNVSVAGVDLGGKTPEEAAAALHQATDKTYTQQDMVVELPDTTLTLSPADTGASLNVESAVEAAYNYGRDGSFSENRKIRQEAANNPHALDLTGHMTLDTAYIEGLLKEYCEGFNSEFSPSSAVVNGNVPVLDSADETFDMEAEGQTLVLTTGTPGRYVDPEKLCKTVLDAYSSNVFQVTVDTEEEETLPESLAAEVLEFYETHSQEPVDATMDMTTFEVSHEVYGYSFDLEAVLTQLEEAAYGETIEIPFQMVAPENTKESLEGVLFRDVLASYETKHTNNSNRNTNLTLACAAVNGYVLNPGDTFDYNKVVGKRTKEAGYKTADAYSGGKTVQTLGGGICQVSSTIYYCTLIADLEIVTRTAHSYTSSYMPLGMDATVSWGGPEFRFKNNTNYPIRIEAEVSGGYVKVKLIGTDEKDYYIEMEYETLSNTYATTVYEEHAPNNPEGYKDGQVIQTAYNGCTVQTYKCKYDKETKELISREEEALSKYKKRDKIICKIVTEPAPTEAPAATEPIV
ncbi:MAG: VanW family protein [Oscillospiraceae bacterium]|nr:VanW family protein [Oscillospiraceae bacterium]